MPRANAATKSAGSKISGSTRFSPLETKVLNDLEAMIDVLENIMSEYPDDDDNALSKAQNLVYEAWDCNSPKKRIALAKKAVKISPLCAEGYILLAEHADLNSDAQLDYYNKAVMAGEAALGEDGFDAFAGEFWGFLETRPYMRARLGLAETLWDRGQTDKALDHMRGMLKLNPNDNQGVRYYLADYLLHSQRDDELAALLKRYKEDGSAAWTFTMALHAFRQNGNAQKSRKLLSKAVAGNGHVVKYLTGARKMPKSIPLLMAYGSREEAICYVDGYANGWKNTPGAMDWLKAAQTSATPKSALPKPQHTAIAP